MKLRDLPWSQWMPAIVLIGSCAVMFAILVPGIQHVRNEARKITSKNNLKQLGLALLNYHDVFDCLPPGGVITEKGVPFHGWFTSTTPFVDASPLYSMVNFGYPWTDPENAHLFRNKYRVALMPSASKAYTTDGFALLHYLGNPNLLHRNSSVKLDDLEAGLEETWLLGEVAGNYQPWGYPFNWRPLGTSLNSGPDSYGRPTGDGAMFVMADASVRFLQNEVDPSILKALANAPPVAPAEAVKVPNIHFGYARSDWTVSSVDLGGDEFEGSS